MAIDAVNVADGDGQARRLSLSDKKFGLFWIGECSYCGRSGDIFIPFDPPQFGLYLGAVAFAKGNCLTYKSNVLLERDPRAIGHDAAYSHLASSLDLCEIADVIQLQAYGDGCLLGDRTQARDEICTLRGGERFFAYEHDHAALALLSRLHCGDGSLEAVTGEGPQSGATLLVLV